MDFSGFSLSKQLRAGLMVAAMGVALGGAIAWAQTDEIAEIGKLLRANQLDQASQRVDALLATKPRDAQARFLKGLVLTEQNKANEAIVIFTKLTEDFPELPEPYNNLAVLYAGAGQYERARQALEMAIRTHPSYATAHENLGDVYAKLASQAYDKALQIDSSNSAAQTKLALVRDLIGSGNRPRQVAQAPIKPLPGAPATPPAATPAKPVAPPATATPAAPPKGANDEADVIAATNAWATAWAKQDVAAYIASYSKDFKPPKGESRSGWEADRKRKIEAPKKIEVRVENPAVTLGGDGTATIKFRQYYKSNIVTANSSKTLVLSKSGGRWQIVDEKSGG